MPSGGGENKHPFLAPDLRAKFSLIDYSVIAFHILYSCVLRFIFLLSFKFHHVELFLKIFLFSLERFTERR